MTLGCEFGVRRSVVVFVLVRVVKVLY